MKVVFRVDSSTKIGSGHVMRCLTLAEQLKVNGTKVFFICRNLTGNMASILQEKSYQVYLIPTGAEYEYDLTWEQDLAYSKKILSEMDTAPDWLIVDQYSLDKQWETPLRQCVKKIMVIDDLANRQHDCDVLLDQNFYLSMDNRYDGLLPARCKKLLGPRYALLRPEFHVARKSLRQRDGSVKKILIFFGGSDPTNETVKALAAVKMLDRPDIAVDVVVGMSNPYKEQVKQLCDELAGAKFYCQIDNMAELMINADLSIGAGGTATWERCFLGLPALVVIVADNQIEVTEAVAQMGAVWNLGIESNITAEELYSNLLLVLDKSNLLQAVSEKAMYLVESPSSDFIAKLLVDLRE